MNPEQIATEMRANEHEAADIAIAHIRDVMRPSPASVAAGMSSGGRLAAVNEVLDALDEVESAVAARKAPPVTRPLIGTEADARRAFGIGHLEDDDNEWGTR